MLIERGNKSNQVWSAGPKPKREECLFSKWIISQGDLAMEINHFEGSGPEWLVHKNTLCFRQRARFWEGERESTYWCMPAILTLYLFLFFFSNIPLFLSFFFLLLFFNPCFLFLGFQVFNTVAFFILFFFCTWQGPLYSACHDWILLF